MLNSLRKHLDSEAGKDGIFDIVLYGSSVKGKLSPGDIDILIIFVEGTLRQRLDKTQNIKMNLKKGFHQKIDIKQILLNELFSANFFARTGILLEGISLRSGKHFSENLGFKPYTLFSWTLSGLTHSEKIRFNYILAGRGVQGIVKELGGIRVASGAIKIPIGNSTVFEDILKANKVPYNKKNLLEEI
ncbi:MAG: nucleotidyltransferase domain-containing protein [Candidatus Woesearchaeota archaeon]